MPRTDTVAKLQDAGFEPAQIARLIGMRARYALYGATPEMFESDLEFSHVLFTRKLRESGLYDEFMSNEGNS